MPISEVGHARNVQFFEAMLPYVTLYGAVYNPSNAEIELSKLQNKLAAAQAAMDGVT